MISGMAFRPTKETVTFQKKEKFAVLESTTHLFIETATNYSELHICHHCPNDEKFTFS